MDLDEIVMPGQKREEGLRADVPGIFVLKASRDCFDNMLCRTGTRGIAPG